MPNKQPEERLNPSFIRGVSSHEICMVGGSCTHDSFFSGCGWMGLNIFIM